MDDGSIHEHTGFLVLAAKSSPDDLLLFTKYSTNTSPLSWGATLEYSEGFPFERVSTELDDYTSSFPTGEMITAYPANLIAEWTKQDPQAAYDWIIERDDPSENVLSYSNLDDFIKVYAETASADHLGEFIAGNLSWTNQAYYIAAKALAENSDPEVYRSFIENLDENTDLQKTQSKVIQEAIKLQSNEVVALVLETIPKEQHFELFSNDLQLKNLSSGHFRNQFINSLVRTGHARKDIIEKFPDHADIFTANDSE